MKKYKKELLCILLIIIIVGSSLGYLFANMINFLNQETDEIVPNTYFTTLEESLSKAKLENKVIKESVLSDLIKRNEANDYSLETALNILGYPICVLESNDSVNIVSYTNENDIKNLFLSIPTKSYMDNSYVQLYWLKENGETIITWIALNEENMSELKIIGIVTSNTSVDKLNVLLTDKTIEDFKEFRLNKRVFDDKYNPTVFQIQNKLLNCKFTKNLINEDGTDYIITEEVLKTKDGYLFVSFKDEKMYLVNEQLNNLENVSIYEDMVDKTLSEQDFINLTKARLVQIYKHTDDSIYTTYVTKTSTDYLIYYQFIDGVMQ